VGNSRLPSPEQQPAGSHRIAAGTSTGNAAHLVEGTVDALEDEPATVGLDDLAEHFETPRPRVQHTAIDPGQGVADHGTRFARVDTVHMAASGVAA